MDTNYTFSFDQLGIDRVDENTIYFKNGSTMAYQKESAYLSIGYATTDVIIINLDKENCASNMHYEEQEKKSVGWYYYKMKCYSCKATYNVKSRNSIYLTKCIKCDSHKVKEQ